MTSNKWSQYFQGTEDADVIAFFYKAPQSAFLTKGAQSLGQEDHCATKCPGLEEPQAKESSSNL